MEAPTIDVQLHVVQCKEGNFIARAIGYQGVIAWGETEEQVMQRIKSAWFTIQQVRSTLTPNSAATIARNAGLNGGRIVTMNVPLKQAC
jgi:hypothetical protein